MGSVQGTLTLGAFETFKWRCGTEEWAEGLEQTEGLSKGLQTGTHRLAEQPKGLTEGTEMTAVARSSIRDTPLPSVAHMWGREVQCHPEELLNRRCRNKAVPVFLTDTQRMRTK